jgi:hypothetical protein
MFPDRRFWLISVLWLICGMLVGASLASTYGMAQERAELAAPKPIDAVIRSYEVIGLSVQTPSTIFKPVATPTANLASPPPTYSPTSWNLVIRYVDNLGTEYIDAHQEGTNAQKLIEYLVWGTSGPIKTRLLQHLIDEGKIGPAKVRSK